MALPLERVVESPVAYNDTLLNPDPVIPPSAFEFQARWPETRRGEVDVQGEREILHPARIHSRCPANTEPCKVNRRVNSQSVGHLVKFFEALLID